MFRTAPVILGTMTWGTSAQVRPKDAELQIEALVAFVDALNGKEQSRGAAHVPVLDTARVYQSGETEQVIGAILAARPDLKSRVKLHSKAHPMVSRLDAAGVRAQLQASLKALGVKRLDVFYLHSPDVRVPLEETLRTCETMHQEGLFDELGLSNYAAWDVANAHFLCERLGFKVRPTIYQGVYNALNRTIEPELLPCCRTFGMRVVVYNPLGAGLLTGRYRTKEDVLNATSGRFSPEFDIAPIKDPKAAAQRAAAAYQIYRARYSRDGVFNAVEAIRAGLEGIPMSEAALRWTMHHSLLSLRLGDGILFGASSVAQAKSNFNACLRGPLSPSVAQVFSEAVEVAGPAESYIRGYDPRPGHAEQYLAKF